MCLQKILNFLTKPIVFPNRKPTEQSTCCEKKKKIKATIEERLCAIQCLDSISKQKVENAVATVNGDTQWFIHIGRAEKT